MQILIGMGTVQLSRIYCLASNLKNLKFSQIRTINFLELFLNAVMPNTEIKNDFNKFQLIFNSAEIKPFMYLI